MHKFYITFMHLELFLLPCSIFGEIQYSIRYTWYLFSPLEVWHGTHIYVIWTFLCKIPILHNDCFKYPWIICIEEGWGRRAPITRTNIITVVHWFVNIHILLRKSPLLDCSTNVRSSTCKWCQSSMTILFVFFTETGLWIAALLVFWLLLLWIPVWQSVT